MSTYLERNPPNAWQFGPSVNGVPVRNSPTCVLHTYQADWPALHPRPGSPTGAGYIQSRRDSAGYHHLTGLDTSVQLAPWNTATAHAIPVNVWAKGFSCMWFAGRWNQLSAANRATLVNGMARGVYEYSQWRVRNGMSAIIPRKITRAQAMRGENGIVYHGDLQDDRTDPGQDFPLQQFLTELRRLQAGGSSTPAAPPVLEGEVIVSWSDQIKSLVTGNNISAADMLARAQNNAAEAFYTARDILSLVQSADWRDRLASTIWNRPNGASGKSHAAHTRRGDNADRTITSLVTGAEISLNIAAANAQKSALDARNEVHEANQKLDAVADAVAELVGQIDANTRTALQEKLAAIKTESARVSATDVAAELEVTVKEKEED